MSLDDRDYFHEDRKKRIRQGRMDDIYYDPREFRHDRNRHQGETCTAQSHLHRKLQVPAALRPKGCRITLKNKAILSKVLWFLMGMVVSFFTIMVILVTNPEALNAPFLWVDELVLTIKENLQGW